jgi:hypothetical protein
MSTNTIEFSHLTPAAKMLRFYNKNKTDFNFAKTSTRIKIFYNGADKPHTDFYAELHIVKKNQPHGQTFEVIIPHGSKSTKIIVETNNIGHDANDVDVALFE